MKLAGTAVVLLLVTASLAEASVCGEDYYGDVDNSGAVDILDTNCATLAALAVISDEPWPTCVYAPSLADMDCNGAVHVSDVLLSIHVALKIPLHEDIDGNNDGCPDTCDSVDTIFCDPADFGCDDGNACTSDVCDLNFGCFYPTFNIDPECGTFEECLGLIDDGWTLFDCDDDPCSLADSCMNQECCPGAYVQYYKFEAGIGEQICEELVATQGDATD